MLNVSEIKQFIQWWEFLSNGLIYSYKIKITISLIISNRCSRVIIDVKLEVNKQVLVSKNFDSLLIVKK